MKAKLETAACQTDTSLHFDEKTCTAVRRTARIRPGDQILRAVVNATSIQTHQCIRIHRSTDTVADAFRRIQQAGVAVDDIHEHVFAGRRRVDRNVLGDAVAILRLTREVPEMAEIGLVAGCLHGQNPLVGASRKRNSHFGVACGRLDHTATFVGLPIAVVVEVIAVAVRTAIFRSLTDRLTTTDFGRTLKCTIAATLIVSVSRHADAVLTTAGTAVTRSVRAATGRHAATVIDAAVAVVVEVVAADFRRRRQLVRNAGDRRRRRTLPRTRVAHAELAGHARGAALRETDRVGTRIARRRIRTRGVAGAQVHHRVVGAGRGQHRNDREDQETSFLEGLHDNSPSGAHARDTGRRQSAERGHLSFRRFAETSRILCPINH